MRRSTLTLALSLAALISSGSATAAPTGDMNLGLHVSRRVLVNGEAASVIVGDPKIADAALVDAHSVVLTGFRYGRTNVIVLDRAGHTLLESYLSVVPPGGTPVTLYRGRAGTEYSCAPMCARPAKEDDRPADTPSSDGDSGGGGAPPASSVTISSQTTISRSPAS